MSWHRYYFCPSCDDVIEVAIEAERVVCPHCKVAFNINYDSEFIDGSWKGRTTLTEVKRHE